MCCSHFTSIAVKILKFLDRQARANGVNPDQTA